MTRRILILTLAGYPSDDGVRGVTLSHTDKELAYLLLKENEDGKHTDGDELVEQRTQHLHLKHTADNKPYHDEQQGTDEHIQRPRITHETIYVIQENCDKQYVDSVLYAESEKHL